MFAASSLAFNVNLILLVYYEIVSNVLRNFVSHHSFSLSLICHHHIVIGFVIYHIIAVCEEHIDKTRRRDVM